MILKEMKADKLNVYVYDTRVNMGKRVANDYAEYVKALLKGKDTVNVIFAAAPSQLDFLSSLAEIEGIEWNRINVFHMDEYIGVGIDQEQSFARFVKVHVADRFHVKEFFPLNGKADNIEEECKRYTVQLQEHKPDIVCLGIGENGHIAFNDPGVADFWDDQYVKTVKLDEVCRNQQVNDKCFPNIDSVPKYAMTLTVPALMRAQVMFCTVPAATKAKAVRQTVLFAINDNCPASALRLHKNAYLYCDKDSGKYIL